VNLPGAQVTVTDAAGKQIAQALSDESGHFSFVGLVPARYKVTASLASFVTTSATAAVVAGRSADLSIDLPIEGISQSVEVVAKSPVVSNEGTVSQTETISGKEIDTFASSGGLQATMRLLASVIEAPNGVSIRGGRPSQAGVQLGVMTMVDPSTGLARVTLPDDAIESVSVLPNPYAVEFGRFSSGVVVIQTRRAGDEWKLRINDIDPTFRTHRGSPVDIIGLGRWAPRVEFGGPIVKDKLFVEQAMQFVYTASDVPSLPETLLHTATSFSSFTRVDANLDSRHSLVGTFGWFPGKTHQDLLGTWTPPDATVDTHVHADETAVTERAVWTDSLFGETTVHVHRFTTDVAPQGAAPMQLLPDTTLGNFFNNQYRATATYQVIATLSGSHSTKYGSHLFKGGIDLLRNDYDGSSLSRPVLIERSDSTLARMLTYSPGLTAQTEETTDLALFAQDRYQPNARWYVEFGGRIDRDGILDRYNVTPRVGSAVLLDKSGAAVLRGGFGLFFERTPSTVGAFAMFPSVFDQRFEANGTTPIGPPVMYTPTVTDLQTARSRTWDLGLDYRFNAVWSMHVGMLDRQGRDELIVNPVATSATTGQLLLSSSGNSSYVGGDVSVHFSAGERADLNVTYTRSRTYADLNAMSNYFDTIMWPVLGRNEYAPAPTDAPNRLLARGRFNPWPKWLVLGIVDWRNGFPWSPTTVALDYVSPRNSLRFPNYFRLEAGLERHIKLFRVQPWLGVRVYNALDSFLPVDVQSNLGSPNFGAFYNSEYPQIRIVLRFER
ncbi:MAG TPA: carboxypeptidase regulatory-like domain-containing protein, partial [Vicinamibacterales bacterium]|nr:carboxypeptidase regulatory-like domain-containing protein [Vicinamibacterales bacterium]